MFRQVYSSIFLYVFRDAATVTELVSVSACRSSGSLFNHVHYRFRQVYWSISISVFRDAAPELVSQCGRALILGIIMASSVDPVPHNTTVTSSPMLF